jgi:nucleotidyltransferase substrate binding protein (TIGR01987 family)
MKYEPFKNHSEEISMQEKKEHLNLTALGNAISTFKDALNEYHKDELNTYVRDSVIQRFEYCYDLSKKMLIRHLKTMGESDLDTQSLADIIRLGAKKGVLLHSWDVWSTYKDNRNATSHGYNENVAINIVSQLDGFSKELDYFLEKLHRYHEH